MAKRVLIVGNISSQHLANLVTKVNQYAVERIEFDIFDTSYSNPSTTYYELYHQVFYLEKNFPSFVYKIPLLRGLVRRMFDLRKAAKKLAAQKYDLINIHFVTTDAYYLWPQFKKLCQTIMLSPWGSDVYRLRRRDFNKIKSIYDKSSYVSAPKIKFKRDIQEMFNVDGGKFIDLGFGSDIIDSILLYESITRDEAKCKFQLQDYYVITCGYNGSKLQNHLQIIRAIERVRNHVKENIFLILPMTYAGTVEYVCEVEEYLINTGIPYRIFKDFLSDQDMVFLRKCSDMFIHAQPTDAFSGSVQEYLLTNTKVINGKWTRYPDLEKFGVPYLIFNNFEELPEVILSSYGKPPYLISSELKEFVFEKGWEHQGKQWAGFFSYLPIESYKEKE